MPKMIEEHPKLQIARVSRKSRKNIRAWTADSLRIREILVYGALERVNQIFFFVHVVRGRAEFRSKAVFSRIPRSTNPVDQNRGCMAWNPNRLQRSEAMRQIPFSTPCIDRRECGLVVHNARVRWKNRSRN